MKAIITCTALPPSRHPTGSMLKAVVVKPHLQQQLIAMIVIIITTIAIRAMLRRNTMKND